jgi:hypothetical protein
MQVAITVKVNGQVVREHVQQVDGSMQQMEEGQALAATVPPPAGTPSSR